MFNQFRPKADGAEEGGSYRVEQALVDQFIAQPANPYLVSFPRTGSHWLRMLIELYFERPTLVRAFYFPEKRDYLLLHSHDNDLAVQRTHVLYLYRDPVDTIYSQIKYYQESHDDPARITYWGDLYGRHLDKWLHQERFTEQKTILTYEGMKRDLPAEFAKVTDFFGQSLDPERLQAASGKVTKEEVKSKTAHDPQVMQLGQAYEMSRDAFRHQHSNLVWQALTANGRVRLRDDFGV